MSMASASPSGMPSCRTRWGSGSGGSSSSASATTSASWSLLRSTLPAPAPAPENSVELRGDAHVLIVKELYLDTPDIPLTGVQ